MTSPLPLAPGTTDNYGIAQAPSIKTYLFGGGG